MFHFGAQPHGLIVYGGNAVQSRRDGVRPRPIQGLFSLLLARLAPLLGARVPHYALVLFSCFRSRFHTSGPLFDYRGPSDCPECLLELVCAL